VEPNILIKGDRVIRRRKRKNSEQMRVLEYEFARDREWTKERLFDLSRLTGLSEGQIYKWGWDQKKKLATGEITEEHLLKIKEAGMPAIGSNDEEEVESEEGEKK
jgi:Homeodomain